MKKTEDIQTENKISTVQFDETKAENLVLEHLKIVQGRSRTLSRDGSISCERNFRENICGYPI